MKKLAQQAAQSILKKAAFTEHGRSNEVARAIARKELADAYREADAKSPGMAYLKGTMGRPTIQELLARREAYKAEQRGVGNLKTLIPFVGMGSKGQEALEKLLKENP